MRVLHLVIETAELSAPLEMSVNSRALCGEGVKL